MYISRKTYTVSRAVFTAMELVGVLSVAILAPNALQIFKMFDRSRKEKKQKNSARLLYDVNSTIVRLAKEKCIKVEYREDGTYVSLTEKGKGRLLQYESSAHRENKDDWDGKWRLVVFDVSERKRKIRDTFRRSLVSYGFMRMQNSVWIYPFECEDFISIIKTDKKLWGDVLYVVADHVEGVDHYKRVFGLT